MFKISTRPYAMVRFRYSLIISLMAAATYYIYDAQRRMSIDYDLKDFADFLTADIGQGTSTWKLCSTNWFARKIVHKKNTLT